MDEARRRQGGAVGRFPRRACFGRRVSKSKTAGRKICITMATGNVPLPRYREKVRERSRISSWKSTIFNFARIFLFFFHLLPSLTAAATYAVQLLQLQGCLLKPSLQLPHVALYTGNPSSSTASGEAALYRADAIYASRGTELGLVASYVFPYHRFRFCPIK